MAKLSEDTGQASGLYLKIWFDKTLNKPVFVIKIKVTYSDW